MLKLNRNSRKEALLFAESAQSVGSESCDEPPSSQPFFLMRMATFRAQAISFTLIAIGLAISIYHLWRLVVLAGRWSGRGTDVCLAVLGGSCDAMLTSPASVQFGLPVAGWGLIYYATLAVFLLLASNLGETFDFEARFAAFLLSLPGSAASVVLAGMMLTGHTPFCPLCALAHLVNVALVFSLLRLTGRSIPELIQAFKAGANYVITGQTADRIQARWKVLGLSTVALVGVVLYQGILSKAPAQAQLINPQKTLASFQTNAEQDIPVGADDPILGPANAPAQMVVFSDFQCPACKGFAGQLHTLAEQYPKELQIVYKHYPLSNACNPTMQGDMHPRACEAAYAAEAARKQGKFWPLHDKLFASALRKEDGSIIDTLAQDSGLDLQRFRSESLEESTKAKVHADIELATRLKVRGTPTVFLNGRPVSDRRLHAMRVLIDDVVKQQRTEPSGASHQRVAAASSEKLGVSH